MKNSIKNTKTICAIIFAVAILSSCNKMIKGEGELNNYTPALSTFSSLDISIPAEISVIKGSTSKISITIQDNIYRNTDIYIEEDELNIEFDKNVKNIKPISIDIELNEINEIELSGASDIIIMDAFTLNNDISISTSGSCQVNIEDTLICNNFDYESSGSGSLNANYIIVNENTEIETSGSGKNYIAYLKTGTLKYDASGSGEVKIAGETNSQNLESSGSGKYYGVDFLTKNTKIDASGSAFFEVAASDILNIDASGSATVRYKGNPKITQDTSGSFKLEKLD